MLWTTWTFASSSSGSVNFAIAAGGEIGQIGVHDPCVVVINDTVPGAGSILLLLFLMVTSPIAGWW